MISKLLHKAAYVVNCVPTPLHGALGRSCPCVQTEPSVLSPPASPRRAALPAPSKLDGSIKRVTGVIHSVVQERGG